MSSTGISREEADRLKKNVLVRDGGYTNANAAELKAIDALVTDEVIPLSRNDANKIREEAGLVNMTKDIPVNVVKVEEERERQLVPQTPSVPAKRSWTDDQMNLIKAKVAPDCTDSELKLLLYMADTYGLDPLLKQIWAVKRSETAPALIFVGRDGMLEVAHRSGHFDGMKSWVEYTETEGGKKIPYKGKCTIWRNDMSHPFESEVLFSEYEVPIPKSGHKGLWQTKPSVMLIKVAESVCLRKAFRVSGLYDPDEMG